MPTSNQNIAVLTNRTKHYQKTNKLFIGVILMNKNDLRNLAEQALFEKKMEENGLFSPGQTDEDLIPLMDLGFYKASIPLIETGGMLFIGVLTSGKTPNGQDFLDLTPIQDFEDAADEHFQKTGMNVRTDVFNSYQECLKNPLLVSLQKLSRDEWFDLSQDLQDKK